MKILLIAALAVSALTTSAFASCGDGKGPAGYFREGGFCDVSSNNDTKMAQGSGDVPLFGPLQGPGVSGTVKFNGVTYTIPAGYTVYDGSPPPPPRPGDPPRLTIMQNLFKNISGSLHSHH